MSTLSLVAEFIGWCVMIPGAALGLAFAVGAVALWLRGPEPVRIERTYAAACICPKCQIERIEARKRGGVA